LLVHGAVHLQNRMPIPAKTSIYNRPARIGPSYDGQFLYHPAHADTSRFCTTRDVVVAERVRLDHRDADDQVGGVGRRSHEQHHPVHTDPPHLLVTVLRASPQQPPLPPNSPPDHDQVHGDEEHVADGLAESGDEGGQACDPRVEYAHAGQPR
jgi:hypothetical protein